MMGIFVIQVSALTSVRSGQYKGLPMKHLLLIDTQDMVPVKLTVFSDDAHKQYKVDDFVKATNVYTKEAGLRCRKQSKVLHVEFYIHFIFNQLVYVRAWSHRAATSCDGDINVSPDSATISQS